MARRVYIVKIITTKIRKLHFEFVQVKVTGKSLPTNKVRTVMEFIYSGERICNKSVESDIGLNT